MLSIGFWATPSGRSPAVDFLDNLQVRDRYYIDSDIATFALHGDRAPVSIKSITGRSPMREIRTGGFRIIFVRHGNEVCILGVCKKQDQLREFKVCQERMKAWLASKERIGR